MNSFPEFRLENFKILDNIGKGSYGKVFMIEYKEDLKRYAAKESKNKFIPNNPNDPFLNEINTYSKVSNHAILPLFGYSLRNFKGANYPIMIMEYMPNGSLGSLFTKIRMGQANKYFSSTKKYIILIGIALGMKYLHYKGIIHRDLKPDNVLLDANFHPKICDFGCSKTSNDDIFDIVLNTEEGTPIYMAPEIFDDDFFDHQVDVYAFSLIAYELITGKIPFKGYNTKFKLVNDIKQGKRPETKGMNEVIRSFLENCWCGDPSKRMTFDDTVEVIMSKKFRNAFGNIDFAEVEAYLNLFDEDLKNPKSMSIEIKKEMKNTKMYLRNESKDQLPKGGRFMTDVEMINFFNKIDIDDTNFLVSKNHLLNMNGNQNEMEKSAKELKKYAEMGDEYAMIDYSQALQFGRGVTMNLEEAAMYMKKAADLGNRLANVYYADMLHEGIGVPKNISEAVKYVKIAAVKGHEGAMFNYAASLEHGQGIEVNKKEAAKYYWLASIKGNGEAMLRLGRMIYLREIDIFDKKYALDLFLKSAEFGSGEGMFYCGIMLRDKNECQVDLKKSTHYFQMAAEKKYQLAYKHYAFCLYYGTGTIVNKKEASKYFKLAADDDFLNANDKDIKDVIKFYAEMQYYGDGIPVNKKEAAKYFKKLADLGDEISQLKYGELLSSGDVISKNQEEDIKYVKKAADKGNRDALFLFGFWLFTGQGVKVDKEKAILYFKKSAMKGCIKATIMIKFVI